MSVCGLIDLLPLFFSFILILDTSEPHLILITIVIYLISIMMIVIVIVMTIVIIVIK